MARASLPTWLPLSRAAELLGIHPLHFNQVYHPSLGKQSSACGDVWFQYAWQSAHKTAREDFAQAIHDAEQMIADYVSYNLLPDWVVDERHQTVRPARPELWTAGSVNLRGYSKSVFADRHFAISGGIQAVDLIEAALPIGAGQLFDRDGDGWEETIVLTVTVPAEVTDPGEVRLFFAGQAPDFGYEIRPIIVELDALTATITLKRWDTVDPELQERMGAVALDATAAETFVDTVDCYRVWNDPSTQTMLLWDRDSLSTCGCNEASCLVCTLAAQYGCLTVRDQRLSCLAYKPASWDADNLQWLDSELAMCREPDSVRLWYYAGWQDPRAYNTMRRVRLDPFWERCIVRLAAGLLDRDICSCNNAQRFVEHWREELAVVGGEARFKGLTEAQLAAPFGTTRGAQYAWKMCNLNGRRVA
jgi:hypothetical protein